MPKWSRAHARQDHIGANQGTAGKRTRRARTPRREWRPFFPPLQRASGIQAAALPACCYRRRRIRTPLARPACRSAPPKQHGRTRTHAGINHTRRGGERGRARTTTLSRPPRPCVPEGEKSPPLPSPHPSSPLLCHADGSPPHPLGRQRDRPWVGRAGCGSSGGGRACCSSPSLPRPSPWKPPRATLIRSTGTRSSLPPSASAACLYTLLGLAPVPAPTGGCCSGCCLASSSRLSVVGAQALVRVWPCTHTPFPCSLIYRRRE